MERQVTRAVVLVVEENPKTRELITMALETELGVRVVLASDGRSGVELARNLMPDLILLTIAFPALGGLETARQLKGHADTRSIPIVAVSDESRDIAMATGCDDYLGKPFDLRDLTRVVLKHL